MNKELENKLIEDYPDLFAECSLPETQTCMCWGLECGDGWEPIIRYLSAAITSIQRTRHTVFCPENPVKRFFLSSLDKICRKIEKRLKLKPYKLYNYKRKWVEVKGPKITYSQIKEKYGTLRVYYNIHREYSEELKRKVPLKKLDKVTDGCLYEIGGAIIFAEVMSGMTCERCGKPGKLTDDRWVKCLCENCQK